MFPLPLSDPISSSSLSYGTCKYDKKLEYLKCLVKDLDMRKLFKEDLERAKRYSINMVDHEKRNLDILYDYSKNLFNESVLNGLFDLVQGLPAYIEAMYNGEKINNTENRAVLHVALRSKRPIYLDKTDVTKAVMTEKLKMKSIQERIWSGEWRGYTGLPITDIVNIGIGGSDLGPVMVVEALKAYSNRKLNFHFVSNIDGSHLKEVLDRVDPARTIFIIVSKTFTTLETMTNANSAKSWFLARANNDETLVRKHFVAVSTNEELTSKFGIDHKENMIKFWDWVGGRYSLWSGVGLAIMLSVGYEKFEELLEGAYFVDEHFRNAPMRENIPVIMALMGILYNNVFESQSLAILPYEQYLHRFPAYLQQAEMESNGKFVTKEGSLCTWQTCPIIWGEPGTNGQHAFFQLIHQGTKLVPCDFLVGRKSLNSLKEHHEMLLANCLAQTEALLMGKSREQLVVGEGVMSPLLLAHKQFPGNRPSSTLVYDVLSPKTLGALIALYEHKIFVQGYVWNINSYDQWGVELGKQLANVLLRELKEGKVSDNGNHDPSTLNLFNFLVNNNK